MQKFSKIVICVGALIMIILGMIVYDTWKDRIYFSLAVEAVQQLKERDYKVFAIEQTEGSISLEKFHAEPDEKIAVVFGNEVEGVGDDVLKMCDDSIEIPQFGMKHSLNISVAAGIVLWELSKYKMRGF